MRDGRQLRARRSRVGIARSLLRDLGRPPRRRAAARAVRGATRWPNLLAFRRFIPKPSSEAWTRVRMLVLGAGLQGSACAFDLLRHPEVERVTLADLQPRRVPAFLKKKRDKRLVTARLDAKRAPRLRKLMGGHDAVMNALPYYFNYPVAKAAVAMGLHCADLGGNTAIVQKQKTQHAAAQRKHVSVVPDCGLAPGMINIIAAEGIRRVGEAESVKIFVGGLPQKPEPPLNYQIVYSLEGALDYYTTPSWVLREGRPGHVAIMRAIRELGLLSLDPVTVKGTKIVPRDAFIATVSPQLSKPNGRDLVALRVDVQGRSGRRVAWQLLDYYDEATGIRAMMRTTGFSLAITGLMQVDGRIGSTGVYTPDEAVPFQAYVDELRKRGVEIREVTA